MNKNKLTLNGLLVDAQVRALSKENGKSIKGGKGGNGEGYVPPPSGALKRKVNTSRIY